MTSSFVCWHRSRGCVVGGALQPPAFPTSTATLDDLPFTSSEQVDVQHPDSEESFTVLSTEVPTAHKQVSQRQNKPADPFTPSASALPDFMLQSSYGAAASFCQSEERLSLLDADMPQADRTLSRNQPTRDLSAAMPHAATAAAAAAAAAAGASDVHKATSGTFSVDTDAQDMSFTTPDLCPSSNPRQALAVSQDTGTGDAQIEIQAVDHFAVDSDLQNQLEPHETCLPKSPELDSSLSVSRINMLPASGAVTAGSQAAPDKSLVPAAASESRPVAALSTVASETQDQQAAPTASDAGFVSTHMASAKDQQQQQQPGSEAESDAQVDMLKHDAVPKAHEEAMAKAEQAERRLLTGEMAAAWRYRHTHTV